MNYLNWFTDAAIVFQGYLSRNGNKFVLGMLTLYHSSRNYPAFHIKSFHRLLHAQRHSNCQRNGKVWAFKSSYALRNSNENIFTVLAKLYGDFFFFFLYRVSSFLFFWSLLFRVYSSLFFQLWVRYLAACKLVS